MKENKTKNEVNKDIELSQSGAELCDKIDDDKAISSDSIELSKREKHKRKRAVKNAKLLFRAIDILFSMAQNTCPYVDKTNKDTIECDNDIVFDEACSDVCKLDYYRVKSEEKQPAVLLIHGGGFSAGDKKYRKGRAQFFALNGFSVFCVNYGLAPDFVFPEPLRHIVTAANYVYDNAQKFNIDETRIIVDGDSAGAYYAAMLASFNGNAHLADIFKCSPKFKIFGALLNCGVYDMQTVLNTKYPFSLADGVLLSLMGVRGSDFDSYEHKDNCIPIDLVNSEFPPTFLIYSNHDTFCKGQGNIMLGKLRDSGVYTEYYEARQSNSNHCFSLTWSGEDAATANELMMSFAKRLAADKIKI